MTDQQQCVGLVAETGERCRAARVGRSVYCAAHDPSDAARERHRVRSAKGGANRANRAPPISDTLDVSTLDLTDPRGMQRVLAEGIARLCVLKFDVSVAHAMSALVGTANRVHESTEIIARLDQLERTLPRPGGAVTPQRGWFDQRAVS